VGQHLADIVQQRAPFGQEHVDVQLGGHHAGEPRNLF
jgi:hypothetical protein